MDTVITNPCVHRIPFSAIDYLRIAIFSVTIAPIRYFLSFCIFALACGWATIGVFILDFLSPESIPEYHRLRKRLVKPSYWLLRAALWTSGIYKIEYEDRSPETGTDHKKAPILLISPHTSYYDLYPGLFLDGSPSFVARDEARQVVFFQNLLKLAGVILVKRDSKSSRQETIERIRSETQWNQLVICPESTCTNRSALARFKIGAFLPGLPVQPMVVKYRFWNGMDTASWCYIGPSFIQSIWLTMCQFGVSIKLTKLPPIIPTEAEKRDPKLFAENARQVFSKFTGIPCSEYIFDDVFFFKLARYNEIPTSPSLVKLLKVCYKANAAVRPKEVEPPKEGKRRLPVFLRFMDGPESENGRQIFNVKKRNSDGNNNDSQQEEMMNRLEKIVSKVFESEEKLIKHDVPSVEDLLEALGLDDIEAMRGSTAVEELLSCINSSGLGLVLAAKLATTTAGHKQRVTDCVRLLDQHVMDIRKRWSLLLWHLLGLHEHQLDWKTLDVLNFDVNTILNGLQVICRRAVTDNAPFLATAD